MGWCYNLYAVGLSLYAVGLSLYAVVLSLFAVVFIFICGGFVFICGEFIFICGDFIYICGGFVCISTLLYMLFKTNAVLRRSGTSAVGTLYDRHSSAVRSPPTPWERRGSAVRLQCERRGCVWRLYGTPTASSAMLPRPTALRRRCHGVFCNSPRSYSECTELPWRLLRSYHAFTVLSRRFHGVSPCFHRASTAFSVMLLRCCRASGLLCNVCTTELQWERHKSAVGAQ